MTEVVVKRRRLHAGQLRVKASPARFRSCMFGRRWGKNVLGIDEAMTTALQGKRVGWFEPTYKYFAESWRELCTRLAPVTKRKDDAEKRLELLTKGVIEGWTCDTPDPGRSRAYDKVIVNEAGLIRGLQPLWEQSIRATLTDYHGTALFLGTPKGRSHDFSVLHAKASDSTEWAAFRGPTSENPHIPADEIVAAKRDLPPQVFAQEFEGIPADDGGNPFGLDAIRACTTDEVLSGDPVAYGWDFARAQDWTVGIGLDREYQVVRFHRWQLQPWGETKDRVRTFTGVVPAWGDSTGVGDAVVEDLQRMGCPMLAVTFSKPMKQKLMERLARSIQQHQLRIPDGPIVRELETFSYEYTERGVRYVCPDGMHDDCVMSLALAVYGRDQFGTIPQLAEAGVYQENRHPGFDYETKKRRKPWEEGWKPDQSPEGWLPSDTVEPLGF